MRIEGTTNTASPTTSYFEAARDALAGDPTTQIAAMMLEHAKTSRELNHQQRSVEELRLRELQADQVDQLRLKATRTAIAGFTQGAAGIASGALKIGACGSKAEGDADVAGYLKGTAEGVSGSGTAVSAYFKYEAGQADANGTECEHKSGEALRRLEDLRDESGQLRELNRSALDHLRAIQDAKAATDQAITSYRG